VDTTQSVDGVTIRFWVDYDREADVLYISFKRPQKATDTRTTEEGILLRYHGKELVGITVLEASTRSQALTTPATSRKPASRTRKQPAKKKA